MSANAPKAREVQPTTAEVAPRAKKALDERPAIARMVDWLKEKTNGVLSQPAANDNAIPVVETHDETPPAKLEEVVVDKPELPANDNAEKKEIPWKTVEVIGKCKEGEIGLPAALQDSMGVKPGEQVYLLVGGEKSPRLTVRDIDPKLVQGKTGHFFVTMHHDKEKDGFSVSIEKAHPDKKEEEEQKAA